MRPPVIRAAPRAAESGRLPGSSRVSSIAVAPWGGGGGDEEARTPDPLLAKEVLYQLSYVPSAPGLVVGVSGLEPEASALSGQCSNQLS